MPRVKGAKDKAPRKPKGSSINPPADTDVNLGQEREFEQHDDLGTNDGVPQDLSNEANKDITTTMDNTTQNTNTAPSGSGDSKNNEPVTASGGGNDGGGVKPPVTPSSVIQDIPFEMVPGDEQLPENPPKTDYSPITDGQVIEREYAVNPTLTNAPPIEEPVFTPPKFDDVKPPDVPGGAANNPSSAPTLPPNPQLADKTPEEKKRGAEMMVDGMLDMYSGLGELGARWVEVSPMEIAKLAEEGKIDPESMLHLEAGQVTVSQFIESYNRQAKDVMMVSQQFRDDVRPPLVRIFTNHGWGASDEQYVLFKFGKDILMKGSAIYSLKSTMKGVLTALEKNHAELKKNTIQLDEYGERIVQQEEVLNTQATTIAQLEEQLKAERLASKKKAEELERIRQEAEKGKKAESESPASTKTASGKGKKSEVVIQPKKKSATQSMREPEEE